MGIECRAEAVAETAQIALCPHIENIGRATESETAPTDRIRGGVTSEVEERNIVGSIAVIRGPHLRVTAGDLLPWMPRLIDCNHRRIGEQLQTIAIKLSEIIADKQLGIADGPQRHRALALIVGEAVHTSYAHIERIEIVPAETSAGIRLPGNQVVEA